MHQNQKNIPGKINSGTKFHTTSKSAADFLRSNSFSVITPVKLKLFGDRERKEKSREQGREQGRDQGREEVEVDEGEDRITPLRSYALTSASKYIASKTPSISIPHLPSIPTFTSKSAPFSASIKPSPSSLPPSPLPSLPPVEQESVESPLGKKTRFLFFPQNISVVELNKIDL